MITDDEDKKSEDSNGDVPGDSGTTGFKNIDESKKRHVERGAPDNKDREEKRKVIVEIEKPVVTKIDEKKKKWTTKEYIEVGGFGIALIALFIAIFTFNQTKESVEIADQALKDSRRKDSASDVKDRFKDSLAKVKERINDSLENDRHQQNHVKDNTIMRLSRISVESQISSLKETQKQFEIANRPLLEIGPASFKFANDHKNKV